MLQSWTKSVTNFGLSYPQNTYPADLVSLWPLTSPHPGQCCSVEIRNDPAGLQHWFFWGGRGESVVVGCKYFQQLYLETSHGSAHFNFLNTFVHDCRYFKNRPQEPWYIKIRKEKEIFRTMGNRSSFESVRPLIKFLNSFSLVVVLFVCNHFKVNSNKERFVVCGASKEYKTI